MGRGKQKFKTKKEYLWYEQGGICYFCGKAMVWRDFKAGDYPEPEDATIDHLYERGMVARSIPKPWSCIVLSHYKCNQIRGNDYRYNKDRYRGWCIIERFNPIHSTFLTDEIL